MDIKTILDQINPKLSPEDLAQKEKVIDNLRLRYYSYKDPWGFDLDTIEILIGLFLPLYRKYFKVRVFGQENIDDIPYIFTSNHTGQVPIDGMLIMMALAFEFPDNPRILHGMVERFLASFPFLGSISAKSGSILGDRENCKWLLERNESILVFPEGVKGISKSTPDYYKLQKFSNGFFRIALRTKTPILPVSVIGAEEMFPFVYHIKPLAKLLGLPSFPLSANIFPLPSPVDIYLGKAFHLPQNISHETTTNDDIRKYVYQIEKTIKTNINKGLKSRRSWGGLLPSMKTKIS